MSPIIVIFLYDRLRALKIIRNFINAHLLNSLLLTLRASKLLTRFHALDTKDFAIEVNASVSDTDDILTFDV